MEHGIWFQRNVADTHKAQVYRINLYDVEYYQYQVYELSWPHTIVLEGIEPTLRRAKAKCLDILATDQSYTV